MLPTLLITMKISMGSKKFTVATVIIGLSIVAFFEIIQLESDRIWHLRIDNGIS